MDKTEREPFGPVSEPLKRTTEPGGCLPGSESFDRGMVLYLAMVLALVEGREVAPEEVEDLLCRVMRQHSIAHRRRLEYAVWYLSNQPP